MLEENIPLDAFVKYFALIKERLDKSEDNITLQLKVSSRQWELIRGLGLVLFLELPKTEEVLALLLKLNTRYLQALCDLMGYSDPLDPTLIRPLQLGQTISNLLQEDHFEVEVWSEEKEDFLITNHGYIMEEEDNYYIAATKKS